MSYSAFVVCNCYQKGKTVKPPYEEYVKFDEDGIYLDIPDEIWEENKEKAFQMQDEFFDWKENACEHEEMEQCYEHLSNNIGVAEFRNLIYELNKDNKYPILSKYLPIANGGILPAEYANEAYNELIKFESESLTEERVYLLNNTTNELLASTTTDSYSLVFISEKYYYGIDDEGFFVIENIEENREKNPYEIFRSKKFRQRQIREDYFRLIDYKTNRSFFSSESLIMDNNPDEIYEFSIKKEIVKVSDEYQYIIKPLKKLAKASIETGNPIHWM